MVIKNKFIICKKKLFEMFFGSILSHNKMYI